MSEPKICRDCGAEVWPEHDEQSHRDCDVCGNRVWFKEWARKKFGGDSVPRHVLSEIGSERNKESDQEETRNNKPEDASLEDYL